MPARRRVPGHMSGKEARRGAPDLQRPGDDGLRHPGRHRRRARPPQGEPVVALTGDGGLAYHLTKLKPPARLNARIISIIV